MAVHLTRIYTKTGDDGTTGARRHVAGAARPTPGSAPTPTATRPTPSIGVALALGGLPEPVAAVLRAIQNDLFDVGADLCTPVVADPKYPPLRVTADYVERLEGWCDEFNDGLPKLDSFILPGAPPGRRCCTRPAPSPAAPSAARGRSTRPIRRAHQPQALLYLNRLSDLLFILARVANPGGDVLWKPGGERTHPERRVSAKLGRYRVDGIQSPQAAEVVT